MREERRERGVIRGREEQKERQEGGVEKRREKRKERGRDKRKIEGLAYKVDVITWKWQEKL